MVQAPGVRNAGATTFPQTWKEPSLEQGWADPGGEGGREGETAPAAARKLEDRYGGEPPSLPPRGWDVLHAPEGITVWGPGEALSSQKRQGARQPQTHWA